MVDERPFLLVVAGPNGAGKTSLTAHLREHFDFGTYINPDDIAAGLEGSYDHRVRKAQDIADDLRAEAINARQSFSFETVFSDQRKLTLLEHARRAGFEIFLYFVGVDDPQINLERVKARVEQGGHDVPADKIVARYHRVMELLPEILQRVDHAYIFDNSITSLEPKDFAERLIATIGSTDGDLTIQLRSRIPAWVSQSLLEPAIAHGWTIDTSPAERKFPAARRAPELTVVVPTFKERDNVPLLVEKLARAIDGVEWEVVFVDDNSPDDTAAVVREIGERDARVRCVRRIGRRGLSGACIEGMLASQAKYVAVMDADLQHDETLLIAMLEKLRGGIDLAVASRYVTGGSAAGLAGARREQASKVSTALARKLLGVTLTDPMSGFFMMRRDRFEELAPQLSSQGFKILLDIVATARGSLRIAELPFVFGERQHGESKLDTRVALDFAALILSKLTNDAVSFRFLLFCLVGLTGIATHMAVLQVAVGLGTRFGWAQTIATFVAITWNFVFNNMFTYRDQRLAGRQFVTGLIWFQVICAVGAISNVGIATVIYRYDPQWWIAGLGGALMGAVWNYVVSAAFVWRQR
jgi:dolichol-phosphate mannosyltransferase